jgi:putative ABC transport system ATP-binding protein
VGLIVARGLRKSYRTGAQPVPVLDGVDVELRPGDMAAVMGPSGCGKTTLLNCLSGLDEADAGEVRIGGEDITRMSDRRRTQHRARTMGFVFQAFHLVPVLTALQNVELPLQLLGVRRAEAKARASAAVGAVGLADRASHLPSELSGGQQQRVAIARAIVNRPRVVWADEPTGNLDRRSGEEVLELFAALNRDEGVTFVIVTHDARVAQRANRVIEMDSGRIVRG